ncbi:MAG: serine protease [Sphaerobacteraceae bacterium]|nr:MAG: serine protease [Sphaerobacteraceae bacterium]
MNLLDVVFILLLITGVVMGVQRGFLRTSLDLILLATSAYAGARLYRPISNWFASTFGAEGAAINALSLVIGALGVLLVLNLLISWTVTPSLMAIRVIPPIRLVDNGFGVVPGLVYGILFAAMMTLTLGLVSVGDSVDSALAGSDLAKRLRAGATSATTNLASQTGMDLADFTYVVVPEEEASYRVPPTGDSHLDAVEGYESEIMDLVNQERVERGLGTLEFDASLVPVARAHSQEMLELGYFSHVSPNTGTLGDRLNAAGVQYLSAGENLAYAPSVGVAHRGLMQSDGHRENILDPSWERIGVGVLSAPDGTIMVTQLFAR